MQAPVWRFYRFLEIREAERFARSGGVAIHDTGFPFRRWPLTAHIFARSTDELTTAVRRMGGDPKWIQYEGTKDEHWDAFGSPLTRALGFVDNPEHIQWLPR